VGGGNAKVISQYLEINYQGNGKRYQRDYGELEVLVVSFSEVINSIQYIL
jgi:hypothetical protein